MQKQNWLFVLAAALTIPTVNCATPEGDLDCSDGKCDVPDGEVPDSPCDGMITDQSGAGHKKVIGRNGDPLAKLAFSGKGCPTTFQDIMKKLRETDKEGCPGESDGISTRLVSETAQASGKATSFRSVTTRRCGNRGTEGIVFSLFGLQPGGRIPGAVEMIAFDETAGVFNFYDSDGSSMNFFGSSKDLLDGPGGGEIRRCANCHTGGGLVMKELDTPWMHWEGHENSPGSDDVMKISKDLGSKSTGAEFEGVVKNGNQKWNKTRLTHQKGGKDAVQNLLKPLFCSVEFNIDNGSDFGSPVGGGAGGSQISSIPFDSLLDPTLKGFGSIPITFADYDSVIKANGQKLQGVTGAIDTFFDYAFVERSAADLDHVSQLKAAGIIDDDFQKDVLMVDFTRHVFSDDRCGLLTFAPKLEGDNITAAKIRDGFIANLTAESPAEGSPGAVFLANLQATGDGAAHDAKVDTFINACKALGSKPFVQNALAITSLNRNTARERPVMEFPATMPQDNQNTDGNARLNPKTCQLVNAFVAP